MAARISWTLEPAVDAAPRFERVVQGQARRANCLAPTKQLRSASRASAISRWARINRKVAAGNGKLKFTGKVGKRTLRPGTYRLRAVPTDGKGNHSPVRSLKFTVKR